jgi:hypothetical protein
VIAAGERHEADAVRKNGSADPATIRRRLDEIAAARREGDDAHLRDRIRGLSREEKRVLRAASAEDAD